MRLPTEFFHNGCMRENSDEDVYNLSNFTIPCAASAASHFDFTDITSV